MGGHDPRRADAGNRGQHRNAGEKDHRVNARARQDVMDEMRPDFRIAPESIDGEARERQQNGRGKSDQKHYREHMRPL
jgi:hypothetical protein